LDPEILACLDLDGLVRIEDQQIEGNLKERRDDLNFECPIHISKMEKNTTKRRQTEAIPKIIRIRILVEHKSDFDDKL